MGGFPHYAPLGYVNVRETIFGLTVAHIVPDPERAPLIRADFELYASGDYTLERLRDEMAYHGLTNRSTRNRAAVPLSVSGLAEVLNNKFHMRVVVWVGVEYPGTREPLVTVQLFNRVQALLESRAASGIRERRHHHYLKGLLVCGVCGRHLSIQVSKGQCMYFFCLGQKSRRRRPNAAKRTSPPTWWSGRSKSCIERSSYLPTSPSGSSPTSRPKSWCARAQRC